VLAPPPNCDSVVISAVTDRSRTRLRSVGRIPEGIKYLLGAGGGDLIEGAVVGGPASEGEAVKIACGFEYLRSDRTGAIFRSLLAPNERRTRPSVSTAMTGSVLSLRCMSHVTPVLASRASHDTTPVPGPWAALSPGLSVRAGVSETPQ
jgi:hypothetical protein